MMKECVVEPDKEDKAKNIVEYILSGKIKSAIYQAFIESKKDIDFNSLDELAVAVSLDTIRFLENQGLITINSKDKNDKSE